MRILHLTTVSQIGGAEQLLISMARHGCGQGYDHIFCTIQEPGPFHEAIAEAGGTALSLGLRNKHEMFVAVRHLLLLLKRYQVDLLHTHLYHAGVLAWLASKTGSVPRRVHTRHYETYFCKNGRRVKVFFDKRATLKADHVIAISNAVRNTLVDVERIPAHRIITIHNGIEVPASHRSVMNTPGESCIVAIGSLHQRKGHRYLIEAMGHVRQQFPGVRLCILGEGPERSALQHLVRALGLGEVVHLPGHVDNVFHRLANADLMIHPSIEEGFGIAILEGMSQECAVIASCVGGVPEIVENNVTGLLVPPADTQALATAIIKLLDNGGLRRKMGVNGRYRLEQRFTIKAMLKGYSELYGHVMSNSAKRAAAN